MATKATRAEVIKGTQGMKAGRCTFSTLYGLRRTAVETKPAERNCALVERIHDGRGDLYHGWEWNKSDMANVIVLKGGSGPKAFLCRG